jgi:hypothetical protein
MAHMIYNPLTVLKNSHIARRVFLDVFPVDQEENYMKIVVKNKREELDKIDKLLLACDTQDMSTTRLYLDFEDMHLNMPKKFILECDEPITVYVCNENLPFPVEARGKITLKF